MGKNKNTKNDLLFLYNSFLSLFSNFTFIAFYGTLLGIIRDNDFINGDDDLDFLLDEKDSNNFILQLDENKINYRKLKKNSVSLIQCSFNNIGPIDIYLYFDYDEYIRVPWDGNLLFAKKDIFPLKNIVFYDKKCIIPNESEKILEQIYGDNWKIPLNKKSYQWKEITKVNTVAKMNEKHHNDENSADK